MISGTLRHEGARRSRALRAVPPDVHLVPRRGNAGRAPVSRFEVDVTGHYRTQKQSLLTSSPGVLMSPFLRPLSVSRACQQSE